MNSINVKNIVLVHGAWADGSSWSKIVPLLQAKGYKVACVQHPLTSIADDVAATKRILNTLDGSALLVGHSYGGPSSPKLATTQRSQVWFTLRRLLPIKVRR
jgi:pimeloyl-ACP methyl ester carboxylesterase